VHKKGSGSISSHKLIELNEITPNQSSTNTSAESQKLNQIINHRDNEISKIFDFLNNTIEILVSMVNQLKSKLEASGESVILHVLISRKNRFHKLNLLLLNQFQHLLHLPKLHKCP
jgi:hypothetical protein